MTSLSIEILSITETHIVSFRDCLDSVAQEGLYLGMLKAPSMERVSAFVHDQIEHGFPQFVAITPDEKVIGWCDVLPYEREMFRHVGKLGMGVHAGYRGQKIGTCLLNATLEATREYGLEKIELEVYASNANAIRLYEKLGFVHEGRKRNARKTASGYDDILLMGLLF